MLTGAGLQSTHLYGEQYRAENGNLHQSNRYIKRYLQVWIAQKCNAVVVAETVLTSAGTQATPFDREHFFFFFYEIFAIYTHSKDTQVAYS